jgi:signal transduction histidine kinase
MQPQIRSSVSPDPSIEPRSSLPGPGLYPGLAWWLPAAFIVFSLLALLAGPLFLSARIQTLQDNAVGPGDAARGEINDIRHAITSGEAAIRGLLLTADERFLVALEQAQEKERTAYFRLVPLAWRLDPALATQAEELRARSHRTFLARAELIEEIRAGAFPRDLLAREEERHDRLLQESEAVKAAIIERTRAARSEIRWLRSIETLLTIGLALLALASSLVVLRISRAHRLRAQAEAELRAAAFSVAESTEVGDVLRRITAITGRADRGESSFVERFDRDTGDIEVVASVGAGAPPVGTRIPYPGSLTEEAASSGSTEVVADLGTLDRPTSALLAESCPRCVALVVPLMAGRDLEGALVILRPSGTGFSDRDVDQRRALGTLAALDMRKAVLLEQARRQHQALQRVVESRERLVRGFSHDVKNPLGAADGHAQLLGDGILGELSDRQRESVTRIRSGIGQALELIGDLIQLARSEAGEMGVVTEPVDVAGVARDAALVYRAAAGSAGLRLEVDLVGDIPAILSDAQRIRQVLGNLLSNAIKFTPPGGTVRLAVESRSGRRSGDPSRWVTLSVEDTGPGIPEEQQERMFAEFQRLDPESSHGEGVGLAISERVARSLGGEIVVDSEVGRGSTFTLWLPARREDSGPQE